MPHLLHRFTGQGDIVVGSPIANRTRAEIEGLIGFFANTLVLRTDLSGNPSFVELLDQVRGMALEAYAHQDLPFEKLVEKLQPDRHLNHSCGQYVVVQRLRDDCADSLWGFHLDWVDRYLGCGGSLDPVYSAADVPGGRPRTTTFDSHCLTSPCSDD